MEKKDDTHLAHIIKRTQNINNQAHNKKMAFANKRHTLFDMEENFGCPYDTKEGVIQKKN